MPIRPPSSINDLFDLRRFSNWCQQTKVTPSEGTVSADSLADGSVTTNKLADLGVTSAKVGADAVTTVKITDNAVDNAKLRDSVALSVIGRATNTTGDPADIAADADGKILVRRAGALGFGTLVDADIPASIARDSEVTTAIATHEGASDPHPGYLTAAEGNAAYQPLASVLSMLHTGTGSPETVLTAPVGHVYLRSDGGAGTTFYVKESGVGNTGWVGK